MIRLNRLGDERKNKMIPWILVFAWCGMIYYFTESFMFTGANTASWISEIVQKLQLGHVDHIDDGFLSWNYIVRKLAYLLVFGLLAALVWRAYIRGGSRWLARGCLLLFARVSMNGISRFSRGGLRFCRMW